MLATEEVTEDITRTRVEAGAKLLDEVQPDWREKVNVDSLQMRSGSACILGQIYGTYWRGVDKITGILAVNGREFNPVSHGFESVCLSDLRAPCDCEAEYEILDALWKEVLA